MSALYPVRVTHTRLRPRHHALAYRVPYVLLDLDETPRLRLFSRERFNLFSLPARDHGAGSADLRGWVEQQLAAAGLAEAGARITLLAMPRCLGLGFNPLSLFFCHEASGALRAVLYEVNNTFGQRHTYLCPVAAGAAAPLRQGAEKIFYVSPFMDMQLRYSFSLQPPGAGVGLHIAVEDAEGVVLHATLAGKRQELTDAALLRLALTQPFLGVKVLAAIHWQAVKIWLKGIALRPRPPAPAAPVSLGYAGERKA
ncbi:DUF1365 domain-containing protein [Acidocella sp. KAb 2-4]|uniref:DUF1365 domain-containing protein n=1 Tax=Acidocella sp. KAb 2-4 TaxID=2885158 RepID=UPI001D0937BF|nr:DUF1365 domain-containing protein [Acidocella sp. KAb 2-4]MCB5943924.1 DUF1365 domain-containing protein [Acidocella sp. KAb 2-4]